MGRGFEPLRGHKDVLKSASFFYAKFQAFTQFPNLHLTTSFTDRTLYEVRAADMRIPSPHDSLYAWCTDCLSLNETQTVTRLFAKKSPKTPI